MPTTGLRDRDEMGICVDPLEEAIALWAPLEQFTYRTAAERKGRHDGRRTAGDFDVTIYSLRKWIRLALKRNPTIMLLSNRHADSYRASPRDPRYLLEVVVTSGDLFSFQFPPEASARRSFRLLLS